MRTLTSGMVRAVAAAIESGAYRYACVAFTRLGYDPKAKAEFQAVLRNRGIPLDGSWLVGAPGVTPNEQQRNAKVRWLLALVDEMEGKFQGVPVPCTLEQLTEAKELIRLGMRAFTCPAITEADGDRSTWEEFLLRLGVSTDGSGFGDEPERGPSSCPTPYIQHLWMLELGDAPYDRRVAFLEACIRAKQWE